MGELQGHDAFDPEVASPTNEGAANIWRHRGCDQWELQVHDVSRWEERLQPIRELQNTWCEWTLMNIFVANEVAKAQD